MQPRIDDPKVGRARPTRNAVRIGALIAAIAVGILWFTREPAPEVADRSGAVSQDVEDPGSATIDAPVLATKRGVNAAGDYTFRFPKGWKVSRDGQISELKAPGSRTVVSLGPGVKASGRAVAADLYALVDAIPGYAKVRRLETDRQRFAGGDAFLISGTAVNEAGVKVRLVVAGIDRGRRTFPVTIFTAADTDATKVLPRVEAIAASVKPRN